jgi:hypothetical protein
MKWPPKAKRAPAKSALRKLRLLGAYRVAAILATTLERPFWFAEQWRGKLADELERLRT